MELPLVFVHRDPVPQNFILGSDRVRLVDWDYAGRCWAAFEIGSFCCTANLNAEMTATLLEAYGVVPTEDDLALLRVMSFVAGMREGTWAVMAKPILAGNTGVPDTFYDEFRRKPRRRHRDRGLG